MKKLMALVLAALVCTACGNKTKKTTVSTSRPTAESETYDSIRNQSAASSDSALHAAADTLKNLVINGFDFERYREGVMAQAIVWYAKSAEDIRLKDYALIDVDGDGRPELWVRGDEGQDYQGVYAIMGDSVSLLANCDVRSELDFYHNAVGFNGYFGDGLVREGFTFLNASKPGDSYFMEHKFNIFSEEQETEYLSYDRNNNNISEEDWNKAEAQLGEEQIPNPVWYPIKQKKDFSDYAE